jgi:hypothetical protein
MVLIAKTKGGSELHGPPYTKAEEREAYKRMAGGPVTFARGPIARTDDKEQPTTPKSPRPSRAKRRRS